MSPSVQTRGKKAAVPDNVYTVLLAAAFLATLGTVIFTLSMCYGQYGALFKASSPF